MMLLTLNKSTIFSFNFNCFFLLHISITPSIKWFHFLQPLMLSSWAESLAYTQLGEMGKGGYHRPPLRISKKLINTNAIKCKRVHPLLNFVQNHGPPLKNFWENLKVRPRFSTCVQLLSLGKKGAWFFRKTLVGCEKF